MPSPDPHQTLKLRSTPATPEARRHTRRTGGGWRPAHTAPRARKETAMEDDIPQTYALELALIALVSAFEARLPGTRAAVRADLSHQAATCGEPPVAEALGLLIERLDRP